MHELGAVERGRWLLLLFCCFFSAPAKADGGHIALHTSSGPYTLTLFTASDPLVTGVIDLSLLVQDEASGEVLSEASAEGRLRLGEEPPIAFSMTRAAASNKLLLAATPMLSKPGKYTVTLSVQQPGRPAATCSTTLSVIADHGRRTTLLFSLLLPLLAILLFLANQGARYQRLRRVPPALH